jgi:predicted amidohydrolase YtcJ
MISDYNSAGITSIGDRDLNLDDLGLYKSLLENGKLSMRVFVTRMLETTLGPLDKVQNDIIQVANDPLFKEKNDFLQIIGVKTYMDGGMLTGSAYMLKPWGVSKMYGITDPEYRGFPYISKERLLPIIRTAMQNDLQVASHTVGDGAVHDLLDVYNDLYKEIPEKFAKTRPCISHSNFMSAESVDLASRLGVSIDMQPAWLYLDAHTLQKQFGYERLRWFQPLKTIFEKGIVAGGGSDHMMKIGSMRSVNPYNPFLGMATAITRKGKSLEGLLHPEEALTREQAIRFYTSNNAWLLFREKELGTIEPGKLADFIIIDKDILTCPPDDIMKTKVLRTYLDGKLVYKAE